MRQVKGRPPTGVSARQGLTYPTLGVLSTLSFIIRFVQHCPLCPALSTLLKKPMAPQLLTRCTGVCYNAHGGRRRSLLNPASQVCRTLGSGEGV